MLSDQVMMASYNLMPIDWEFVVRAFAVVFAVLIYYAVIVQRGGDYPARLLLRAVTDHLNATRNYSTDELDSILRLSLAGIMQLVFFCVLIIISGIELRDLIPNHFEPMLLVYGMLLGIGEATLGSLLGYLGMRTAIKVAPARVPHEVSTWLTMSKGGWIRYYLKTAEAVPVWLALLIAYLYIAVEEIIFRGVLINLLQDAGPVVALIISVALFMTVQIFNMPSWHGAMFPVLGALVIGLTHGSLYLVVPDLSPLVIAHMVAFAIVIL